MGMDHESNHDLRNRVTILEGFHSIVMELLNVDNVRDAIAEIRRLKALDDEVNGSS